MSFVSPSLTREHSALQITGAFRSLMMPSRAVSDYMVDYTLEKDTPVEDSVFLPQPSLVRTLSTQHWLAAEKELSRRNTLYQEAGVGHGWRYFLQRDSPTSNKVKRVSVDSNGRQYVETVKLHK